MLRILIVNWWFIGCNTKSLSVYSVVLWSGNYVLLSSYLLLFHLGQSCGFQPYLEKVLLVGPIHSLLVIVVLSVCTGAFLLSSVRQRENSVVVKVLSAYWGTSSVEDIIVVWRIHHYTDVCHFCTLSTSFMLIVHLCLVHSLGAMLRHIRDPFPPSLWRIHNGGWCQSSRLQKCTIIILTN